MTHEFKNIINSSLKTAQHNIKSVLATVVALEGSSYRKPGVRMLIAENGDMTGAVSGGCIEKEVYNQSQSVFKNGIPKIMTYDGRYRLGCEGTLYILIEPFQVSNDLLDAFTKCIENRSDFSIESYFQKEDRSSTYFGSIITFENKNRLAFRTDFINTKENPHFVFSQTLKPCFKLLIFGGEHDAVKLCSMASLLGWEVHVITSIKDPKSMSNFPGAQMVTAQTPELIQLDVDDETAVVLMNHNYVQDLKYLIHLEALKPKYVGILGSSKRRERLKNDLLDHIPELDASFLDAIYSPTGLDIGSITPEEIALSILSEILSVNRGVEPKSLRKLTGNILS